MDESTIVGAMQCVPTLADALALRGAASAVPSLFNARFEMNKVTKASNFRAMSDTVDGAEADGWTRRPYPPSSTRASR